MNDNVSLRLFLTLLVVIIALFIPALGLGQSNWQAEWDKTLRAAESEGQLTLYGCCYEYDRVIEGFKKKYPKIIIKYRNFIINMKK